MFLVFILSSCSYFNQLNVDRNLSATIELYGKDGRTHVDLVLLTNFKWDNYIILGSYEIPNTVAKKYNIDLSNISKYVTANDTKYILVFLQNRKAIKICEIDSGILLSKTKLLKI